MKIFFKDSLLSLFLLQSAFVFANSNLEVLEVQKQSKYQINKEFPGILLPYEQSKLAFQIPGRLELVYVDIGDKVSKGQVLAELDNSEITAQLNQAKASYNLSSQILSRFKDLREKGHISIQDLDKAKSDYQASKAMKEFYEVKLNQTKLIAPFNGIIQERFYDTGSVISGAMPILEILGTDYVEAHVTIPLNVSNDVIVGNRYSFTLNDNNVEARFTRISPMSKSGTESKLAIFTFDNFYTPGVIANLKLSIEQFKRGVWVPFKSLSQSDQGLWTIYTLENNRVVRDIVEIIYFEDEYALIDGTIQNGDLVILGGASKIVAGKVINSQ